MRVVLLVLTLTLTLSGYAAQLPVDPVMNGTFTYDDGYAFGGTFTTGVQGYSDAEFNLNYHSTTFCDFQPCNEWTVTRYNASGHGQVGIELTLPSGEVRTFATSHAYATLSGFSTEPFYSDQFFAIWTASGNWSNGRFSTIQGEAFWSDD